MDLRYKKERFNVKKLLLAIIMLAAMPSSVLAENVIYLVRHAEKQADSDPELTLYGHARAEKLSDLLKEAEITRIYSTDTRRTLQTATPTAQRTGVSVEIYDPRNFEAFVEKLKQQLDAGKGSILVVGHSNTTPYLAGLLTGEAFPELTLDQYDFLYTVTADGAGNFKATISEFKP